MADDFYVIGIDQSTQGTKVLLLDRLGAIVDIKSMPHRQIINDLGYVEHDLNEIYSNVIALMQEMVSEHATCADKIACVGLSVQRETVGAWSKSSLLPLYNAIVWQCARGADFVNSPEVKSKSNTVRAITGLELSEYFSAAKITWLVDNVDVVKESAQKNDLCIGNMDAFLISKLTGGRSFYTEPSNASRTQLMDLKNLCWSEQLCSLFKVPINSLPQIKDTNSCFGETDFEGVLPHKIPIHAAIGDSQGALFAHGCLSSGQIKATYGTGSSIMMNSGNNTSECCSGIVNSVGWSISGNCTYVLEGNINYSAGIISYLKNDLHLINSPVETEAMARQANASDKCLFVPALSGLGAPYFNGKVRGMILGMSRTTGKNEIVKAALDSIAYQVTDIIDLLKTSYDGEICDLNVDGGATKNAYLMQLQSDISGLKVKVPDNAELSGLGAAYLAGIGLGVYGQSILDSNIQHTVYKPEQERGWALDKKKRWHKAVEASINYALD
ncbi:FGGY-family carbohydrate kinase [Anaerobiospirillum thomasii]|uniref:ATP:glycerol 3-phosphotransferase n=1 Tax=Anaerobiospirillum thomasii TaxID=179995 RepID=A0A2X0WU45_9GAMM|nr:FGGY family carbohydrate kinase [Anaerobiospirillum thomasii]SPT68981.1 Glycerol kinase [Anaerobiospirillum thomasii]